MKVKAAVLVVTFLGVAAVLLVAGCAPSLNISASKPGMTDAEFKRDAFECSRMAAVQGPTFAYPNPAGGTYSFPNEQFDPGLYKTCMESRGYTVHIQRQ